jgi:hypothetical protein
MSAYLDFNLRLELGSRNQRAAAIEPRNKQCFAVRDCQLMSHGLDSGSIVGQVTLHTHACARVYRKLRLAWKNRSDPDSREQ